MKKLFTLTLALLCSCLTAVYAANYVGSKPEAGKSYYLLNVAEGKFLSAADNGTLTLGGAKLAVTVITNANGFQVLTTNKGDLAGALQRPRRLQRVDAEPAQHHQQRLCAGLPKQGSV